jgi:integrase
VARPLARSGVGEGSIRHQHQAIRVAGTRAVRWGWVTTKVVAEAQLGRREQATRGALEEDEVRRALAAVEEPVDDCQVEPAASVALRAAVTGARRSELELAALRWDDLEPDHDGRIVAEWADTHNEPFTLALDDPAGCHYRAGTGGEHVHMDAIEFCRILVDRGHGTGIGRHTLPL